VKRTKKSKLHTSIELNEFSRYFSDTIQDNLKNLSHKQSAISSCVENSYNNLYDSTIKLVITPDQVLQCIKRLKRNSSPGIHRIWGEFLINAMSDALSSHLSYFYSCILSINCVPGVFNTGVMVPVLKKHNPYFAANYRLIIVSSIFLKFFQLIVYSRARDISICNNQFGFRSGFGVYNGTCLLNDLMCNSKYTGSYMFICSLDTEKCFDSIRHDGLFYKLYNVLPDVYIDDSYANGVLI